MIFKYVKELFAGRTPRVRKSHCAICHREMTFHNYEVWGNCCRYCNGRASMVARGFMTQRESDRALWTRMGEPETEIWTVDGVEYYKRPDGRLELAVSLNVADNLVPHD